MAKVRSSLQTRITASFIFLILVISGLTFLFTFGETKKVLKEIVREELGALVSTVATQIDGDSLASLTVGAETTATFVRIRDQLLAIQSAHPDIRYVYTFTRAAGDSTKIQFLVDAEYGRTDSLAAPPSIGDVYDETTPAMLDALVAPAVETDFDSDRWGTFLSGYAPIRNRASAVVGAVGIDMLSTRALEKQAFIGNTIYVAAIVILLVGTIIVLFSMTITRGQRAQDALRESEERYRTLVESALDGIVIYLGDRVAFANHAAAAMLGFAAPAALVGQPLAGFVHPDDLASAEDRVRRVLAGEAVEYPVEVRYVRRDGTELQVENTGALATYQGKPAILSVIRDITERKRAEEALAQERFLLQALMNNVPDFVYFKDRDCRLIRISKALAQAFGVSDPAQAVGKTDFDFFTEEHARQAYEDEQAIIRTGQPVSKEERETWADRPDTWVSTTKVPLRDAAGNVVGTFGISRDITERKQAEEALKNSLSLVEATLETTDNGILVVDPQGAVVKANGRFAEMWRIPADILASGDDERLLDHVLGQLSDPDAFVAKVNALYADPGAESADLVHFKDGRVFERTSKPMLVGGEPKARVWSFLDVTDRKRAEEALGKSEEKYRGLTEHINLGIYRNTVGPEGKFIEANPAIVEMFGYGSKEGFLSMNVSDLYQNPEDRKAFNDKMLKEGFVRDEELWLRKKDGSPFVGSVSAVAVKNEQGQVEYYDGIIDNITDRKRVERALRESEERFRTLYEDSTAGIYRTTPDGRIHLANPALIRMLGYSSFEDLSARRVVEQDYEPSYPHRQFVEIIERDGEVKGLESAWKRKDGTTFFARESARAIRDSHGNTLYYDGTVEDITDRKRAEAALRESEARYRRITEGLTDYQYTVRVEDGRAVETTQSPACASVTGYTAEEYAADPYLWIRMVTPEDRDRVREHVRLILSGEDVPDIEHRIVRKDGAVRWVSDTAIPLRDPSGRLLSYDGVISDITARKRAEDELQKLASVVRYSSELVNLSTLDGKMIFLNEAGSRMLGISPAEVERHNIMQVIPAHLREKVETELLPAMMGVGTWAGELQYLNLQTGRLTDVHATTFTVKDPATGAPLYLANVSLDVTDRKRAEEEIRRKAKDLQEKNEELTRFTYAVSHDLRSPLVTIRTFQGFLEQDVRSQDVARIEKDLRHIRNATDKMGLLLDELLRLSRVGRVTNPPEKASLQSLVKEALDLVAGRLIARGVRVDVTEEPVVLTGDRTRLVEIFQNLVDNATKFMGDEPAPRVEIGVEQAGEELVLFVRDNGIGIEPQLQPLVFDLFRKLDPGTEGVGLGLALVRRIVEVHGGRIWVESEGLGKGTTFRLTLAQTTRKRD